MKPFTISVFIPTLACSCIAVCAIYFINNYFAETFGGLVGFTGSAMLFIAFIILIIGMTNSERKIIISYIGRYIKR